MHMNSYVSDPCLVYKKMVTDGGGGEVNGRQRCDDCDCERNFGLTASTILVPGSNPHLDTLFC